MRPCNLAFILLALVASFFILSCQCDPGIPTNILFLNRYNFDQTLLNTEPLVLLLYRMDCDYSRIFFPMYEELANKLHGVVRFAQLDIATEPEIQRRFLPKKVPSIYLIKDGQVRLFEGTRSIPTLTEFVTKQDTPVIDLPAVFNPVQSVVRFTTPEEFVKAITSETEWLIVFGPTWCAQCEELSPTLDYLAFYHHENGYTARVAYFDVSKYASFVDAYDIKGYPDIKFFSQGKYYNYDGEYSSESLESFILEDYQNVEGFDIITSPPVDYFDVIQSQLIQPFQGLVKEYTVATTASSAALSFVAGGLLSYVLKNF